MIFIDVLALAGAGGGVLLILYFAVTLLRPSSAENRIALFTGETRAKEGLTQGSFKSSHARTLGYLLLATAGFMALFMARGVLR